MDKQNVSLALKFFNMENFNGLLYLANIENKPEYLDTALYLEKMTKWFNVMNVKPLIKEQTGMIIFFM